MMRFLRNNGIKVFEGINKLIKLFLRVQYGFAVLFILFCYSCNNVDNTETEAKKDTIEVIVEKVKPLSDIEKELIKLGLIDVQSIDTSIRVDLKYSTDDNFMKRDVYGALDKAFLQKSVADSLARANHYLNELKPGYRLIIYDASRPKSVQQFMWDSCGLSYNEKLQYLANPASGSLHNYGCAVDISILDEMGQVLDMGTNFDAMDPASSTYNESSLLKKGILNQQQIENRKLLRKVMQRAGFFNVQSEWWHFNACRIEDARSKYQIIE